MNTISNSVASLSLTSPASTLAASGSASTAAAAKSQTSLPDDTVELNPAQQAQKMYYTGHTVPQIAFSLELSLQAVNNYLNISKAA